MEVRKPDSVCVADRGRAEWLAAIDRCSQNQHKHRRLPLFNSIPNNTTAPTVVKVLETKYLRCLSFWIPTCLSHRCLRLQKAKAGRKRAISSLSAWKATPEGWEGHSVKVWAGHSRYEQEDLGQGWHLPKGTLGRSGKVPQTAPRVLSNQGLLLIRAILCLQPLGLVAAGGGQHAEERVIGSVRFGLMQRLCRLATRLWSCVCVHANSLWKARPAS